MRKNKSMNENVPEIYLPVFYRFITATDLTVNFGHKFMRRKCKVPTFFSLTHWHMPMFQLKHF